MANQTDIPLTPIQQAMVETWEQHTTSEFKTQSLEATLATMAAEPHVNHVPVMTGGVGLKEISQFYGMQFIPHQPPDTEIILVSRTIGEHCVVDELIHKFTHTIAMPWMLPGIPPTGKRVEVAVVVVVEFKDGRIASEHIYWDQASVLAQLGLLDATVLPIVGGEGAQKILDPSQPPSNVLIERAAQQEGPTPALTD